MEEGMTFTIEPILCQGKSSFTLWLDGWTAVTKGTFVNSDGGRAAQFGMIPNIEHTILITPDGFKILTE
jgi:methionyl aminopeptidase